MSSDPNFQSPVNPLPPVVIILFAAIMLCEGIFSLGAQGLLGGPEAIGWRNQALREYGFNTDVFSWMLQNGVYPLEHLIRFVSYPFVHGTFTQALFGGAMVLALGKFVGDVFNGWATLVLFFFSCIVGALFYGLFSPGQPYLYGAFPGVYGLIGGFTYLMWLKLGEMGEKQYRAFTLIGFLFAIQLVFGVLFGGNGWWLADLAGFVGGFFVSFILSPGGFAKLRSKIRHD